MSELTPFISINLIVFLFVLSLSRMNSQSEFFLHDWLMHRSKRVFNLQIITAIDQFLHWNRNSSAAAAGVMKRLWFLPLHRGRRRCCDLVAKFHQRPARAERSGSRWALKPRGRVALSGSASRILKSGDSQQAVSIRATGAAGSWRLLSFPFLIFNGCRFGKFNLIIRLNHNSLTSAFHFLESAPQTTLLNCYWKIWEHIFLIWHLWSITKPSELQSVSLQLKPHPPRLA